jgi:hypothetical protein
VGFIDWLFGVAKENERPIEELNLASQPWRLAKPNPNLQPVDIVGESFYVEAFKVIRDQLGLKADSTAEVRVTFRAETMNQHSPDGRAVAVYVLDQKVGYVSSRMSGDVFAELESQKGSKTMSGRIYFGDLREKPARNSVSVDWSVPLLVTEKSIKQDLAREKADDKRLEAEANMAKWLRNPSWSRHVLVPGDRVTFTGFSNGDELPKLVEYLISEPSKSGTQLLVVHTRMEADSAKMRDWLAKEKLVTNLETFVSTNSEFAKYFNSETSEFDVPNKISGKKAPYVPPVTTRVFESDTNVAARAQTMPSDLVLLPEQTLAIHPTFTIYGHLNWRLSDLNLFRQDIDVLFAEVQGKKGDSILMKGKLVEVLHDGEARLEFQFRGSAIGFVPKNETQALIRDGRSWKANAALGLIGWNHKNNLKGGHDCGLTDLDFRR